MDIKPIKSETDYHATLREIEELMDAKADTTEGDRLDVLVTLVEAYEARHYPMDYPDPIEAIKFRMEQQGLTVDDLAPAIGRRNRVYEVLNGKRNLSVGMIRRLHRQFDIPADVLIRENEKKREACRFRVNGRFRGVESDRGHGCPVGRTGNRAYCG